MCHRVFLCSRNISCVCISPGSYLFLLVWLVVHQLWFNRFHVLYVSFIHSFSFIIA